MSKKYEEAAKEMIQAVGGAENINGLHHCQTRLRFNLKDFSQASIENAEKVDCVKKALVSGGMFQIVIGTDVADAYDEVVKLLPQLESAEVSEVPAEKKKPFDIVADFVSSIFSPIVPALAGAGMVKALLAFLTAFSLIDKASQTYTILNLFGDATFAFMPILLAYTTAKKLKCNEILAAVTAGIMCHPTWTGLATAGEAVHFFGIPFYLVKYTNSVIPIVMVLLVQAPLEKFLNKKVPGAIRLVVVPMVEFIIMGTLALSILGPLGDYVGRIFTMIFTFLSDNVGWLECALMGGLYSPLVIFGLHHGLAPLGTMQMSQMGYDGIFGPGVLCANIAQGTASLITGLTSKDSKDRQVGISAGITGLMGTTEPALYGVNVPKKFPLIAGMIGGACGGLFAGLTHTHRFATGSSGLPAVVMYIGDNTMQFFYNILISLAITVAVTAVLTFIFAKRAQHADKASDVAADQEAAKEVEDKNETIKSPVSGTAIRLSEVKDEAFASEALGKGAAVIPADGNVSAPVSGVVTVMFPTGHAFGITSASGAEILVHIGIDTVNMNGEGFTAHVKQGDTVKAGDPFVTVDLQKVKDAGYDNTTMVIVTNTADYSSVEAVTGKVTAGDKLIDLQ